MVKVERDALRKDASVRGVAVVRDDLCQYPNTALGLALENYFHRARLLCLGKRLGVLSRSPRSFDSHCFVSVVRTTQVDIVCGSTTVQPKSVSLRILVVLRLKTGHTLARCFQTFEIACESFDLAKHRNSKFQSIRF